MKLKLESNSLLHKSKTRCWFCLWIWCEVKEFEYVREVRGSIFFPIFVAIIAKNNVKEIFRIIIDFKIKI